jgi:hypothetical protein
VTTDTPPPAASYRVRMISLKWFVRLYADMTCGDCVGTIGPFDKISDAEAAGEATGLPDADKSDTATGRSL